MHNMKSLPEADDGVDPVVLGASSVDSGGPAVTVLAYFGHKQICI